MRVIANLTFDEFVSEFEEEFATGLECPLKTVIGDQAFKLGKTFPRDWGDKDTKWQTWLKDAGFGPNSHVVTSIKSSNMSEMARGRGDEGRARAVYYALHSNVENLDYALAVDKIMFGGRFVKNGNPVFEIAPDPIAPPAPFSHPPYHLYDDIQDELRTTPANGTWLDPHNHHSIPLSSRDAEQATLTQFMGAPEPFLILPLIAPSGAGKTRLISQWMRRYVPSASDTEWDAGFVDSTKQNSRDPQPWCDWEITRPTLIVIDYTFAYDAVVREIAERARRNPTQHKIRLLVIDHIYPKFLKDDHFWGKAFGSPGNLNILERTIIRPPIELKPEIAGSKLLRDVIAAAASLGGKTFTADDKLIIEAEGHLTRMGEASGDETHGDPNAVRHPLFAALMGQAIREAEGGAVDFSKWTRRDLITYYFAGENRLPWTVWEGGRGVSVGAIVCAATLRRGLPIDRQIRRNLAKNADEVIDYAKRVVSSDNSFVIKPFLPDILGEAFLLLFLEFIENDEVACAGFIALLSDSEIDQEIAANFQESISRLARNLANDDQGLRVVQNGWRALTDFLNPKDFLAGSDLRFAVSFSIAAVMEQLALLEWKSDAADGEVPPDFCEDLLQQLEQQFDFDDVEQASTGSNFVDATSAYFQFFEYSNNRDLARYLNSLKTISENFVLRYAKNWTATIVAAFMGRIKTLQNITAMLEEDVNATTENGRTALMFASQYGHLAVVEYLQGKGADINATTEDGTTALMLAIQGGHLAVMK
ncbi:MAG: ankyrin repeat domain-containing protein, partial [Anaerolineales bacterium]|nr:ankyrin repeat domain-containing protein [Anaerolineales bacterium]